MADETKAFDPTQYLTKVGANDYLEVKWRIVWLRSEHPDAVVETQLVSHQDREAVFRAVVAVPGGGSATGYGSEVYEDFRDYIEKAESKALGRALSHMGYGTEAMPGAVAQQGEPGRRGPGTGKGGGRAGGFDVQQWRQVVKDAFNQPGDDGPIYEVIRRAGTDIPHWMEMAKQAPSVKFVEFLQRQAAEQGVNASAVDAQFKRRIEELNRAAGQAGQQGK